MASNYEQPKLATSKQYNASQGNIGQVKQQNVDWTGYESAKIWEAVATGTAQVNESLQTQARLRGALDQTGNLVAENSPITEESYNQGRASVVAAQKKTSFLEQSQQLAKSIAMRGGTQDDYTREVTPLYQEYIKAVKQASLQDIRGGDLDVELDAENLKTARTEMITYAALGYEQFQKTLGQQHKIDLYKLNGNLGTNLKMTLDAGGVDGIPIHIINAYKGALRNNIAIDPEGGSSKAEGVVISALSEYVAGTDMFSPEDMAKLNAVKSTLNMPELANFSNDSRRKVTEAIAKKETEQNKFTDLNISNRILELQNSVRSGTYTAEAHRQLANYIDYAVNSGNITPAAAQSFYSRLNILNEGVAEQKLNSPETLRTMNEGGARLKYKGALNWQELWAKDVFASFLAEAKPDDPASVAEVTAKYLEWAGNGLRVQLPFLKRYGAQQLMTSFTGTFDSKPRTQMDFESLSGYEMLSQSWPMLAAVFQSDSSPELLKLTNEAVPKEFKQAMGQARKYLTGSLAEDMNLIANHAKNNKLDNEEVAKITADSIKGSTIDWLADNAGQATAKWWNSANVEVKTEIARQLNGLVAEPTIQGELRHLGITNLSDVNSVIDGLGQAGYFKNTGNRIVVADTPTAFSNLIETTNTTEDQISEWLASTIDEFASQNKVGNGDVYLEFRDKALVLSIRDGSINPKPVKSLLGDTLGNNLGWEYILPPNAVEKLVKKFLPVEAQTTKQINVPISTVGNPAKSSFNYAVSTLYNQRGTRAKKYIPSVEVATGSVDMILENEGYVTRPTKTAEGVVTIGHGVRIDPAFVAESGGDEARYRRQYRDGILEGNKAKEDLAFSNLYSFNYDQMMSNVREHFPAIANTHPEKLTPQQTKLLQVAMISQWTGGKGGSNKFIKDVRTTLRVRHPSKEAMVQGLVKRLTNAGGTNMNRAGNTTKDGKVLGVDKTIGGHLMKAYGSKYNVNQGWDDIPLKESGRTVVRAVVDYITTHPFD